MTAKTIIDAVARDVVQSTRKNSVTCTKVGDVYRVKVGQNQPLLLDFVDPTEAEQACVHYQVLLTRIEELVRQEERARMSGILRTKRNCYQNMASHGEDEQTRINGFCAVAAQVCESLLGDLGLAKV